MFLTTSCKYFYKQEDDRKPIARVNEVYLYEDDIKHLFANTTSTEDSIIRINNFINQWAAEQLLVDGAKLNLNSAHERTTTFKLKKPREM